MHGKFVNLSIKLSEKLWVHVMGGIELATALPMAAPMANPSMLASTHCSHKLHPIFALLLCMICLLSFTALIRTYSITLPTATCAARIRVNTMSDRYSFFPWISLFPLTLLSLAPLLFEKHDPACR